MRRIMLTLEYDGAGFHGWQLQAGDRTVQGAVEEAVERATTAFARVFGASRTDSGVHALGLVAHFDTDTRLSERELLMAVNHWLPQDAAVTDCREALPEFHAQFSPSTKLYRYRILRSAARHPLREGRVLREWRRLDAGAMREAAAMLRGEHDFTTFCSEHTETEDRVRRVLRSELAEEGDELHYEVQAPGFLYNMVRIVVGTLLQVGLGNMTPEGFAAALAARDRRCAGHTAPARGLTLLRIDYANDPRGAAGPS